MSVEKVPTTPEERAANMARSGSPNEEIALVVGLSDGAMARLGEHLELERATRRFELRKKQTELAMDGNEQMLRVLGEIELEQARRDRELRRERLPDPR